MRASGEGRGQKPTESARDWARGIADKAVRKAKARSRVPNRGNREKELFALRAQHIKSLFHRLETFSQTVNKEAAETLILAERTVTPKNLGGIEVPDRARLVLKFLDRRLEIVVNPLENVGGRPMPLGGLASGAVIQYDDGDPTLSDWFDITLREDGWHRKVAGEAEKSSPTLADRDMRSLIEWLVS